MKKLVFRVGIFVLALIVAGVVYEQWARMVANRKFKPVGQFVSMPAGKVHLHCLGARNAQEPTVILQSGLDLFGSLSWVTVQDDIAREFRVCSYDRPGVLWSEPASTRRDAITIANELNSLLNTAGEGPPYLLVGHSLGGLMAQVHAGLFPVEVQGLMLVDSSHPEQAVRLPLEAIVAEASEPPPDWLVATAANVGALRLFDPFPRTTAPEGSVAARELASTSVVGVIHEVRAMSVIAAQASEAILQSDLPVVVLSRSLEPEGIEDILSPRVVSEVASVWSELQTELAGLTDHGRQRVVRDAGHYIHHDQPETFVREVLALGKLIQRQRAPALAD